MADLVSVVALMERWRMGDPAKVYERIEAMERRRAENSREAREARAKQELEALFEEVSDDRSSDQRD